MCKAKNRRSHVAVVEGRVFIQMATGWVDVPFRCFDGTVLWEYPERIPVALRREAVATMDRMRSGDGGRAINDAMASASPGWSWAKNYLTKRVRVE